MSEDESPLIDGVTDPAEIRRRITGDMRPPVPTPPGGWTSENIGPEIRRLTEASRPIVVRLPVGDEYCNICENFPCLGNHPAGTTGRRRDEYTFSSVFNVVPDRPLGEWRFGPFCLDGMQAAAQGELRLLAEVQDRAEWIEGVRRRLGLVAEVHRCQVHQGNPEWIWSCLRDGCHAAGYFCPSQEDAIGKAVAHTRAFVPQPPEEEPPGDLGWDGYVPLVECAAYRCGDGYQQRRRS
jgi:hypothetical protein